MARPQAELDTLTVMSWWRFKCGWCWWLWSSGGKLLLLMQVGEYGADALDSRYAGTLAVFALISSMEDLRVWCRNS